MIKLFINFINGRTIVSDNKIIYYFSSGVGRSVQIDDVIGMFGEDSGNASGNKLLSFFNEVELIFCNGRKIVFEPECTRVRPRLKQKINNTLYYNRCSVTVSIYRRRLFGTVPY